MNQDAAGNMDAVDVSAGVANFSHDVVHTDAGAVRGIVSGVGYRAFLGIPYAAPPIGRLRWAPPAPVARWHDLLDTTKMKPNCLQLREFFPPQPLETLSEDCLTLNVWTPTKAGSARKPSMPVWFWVHGGAFHGGGSNQTVYNGKWNAMRSDVVVVVANYRLNIFGFLGSGALRSRDAVGGTGNYGMLDQRAAMQWVNRNIACFGGDPKRVMLAGQSAGGASVYYHLVAPRSWGLFFRAVAMSGGFAATLPQAEAADFETTFELVVNITGCNRAKFKAVSKEVAEDEEDTDEDGDSEDGDKDTSSAMEQQRASQVVCLEQLPASQILRAWRKLQFHPEVRFDPVVDNVDLTSSVAKLMRRGQVAPGVPLIAGATSEDLDYPLWHAPKVILACDAAPSLCTKGHFIDFVQGLRPYLSWSDAEAASAVAAYSQPFELPSGGDLGHWYWAARKMGTDSTMICPARRSAKWISAANSGSAPAYVYTFQHRPDGPSGSYPLAAHHSSELPFVFRVENADDDGMLAAAFRYNTSRERPLADEMADALITFAATGMPPIGWPAYDDVNQSMMLFGTPSGQLLTGTVAHGLKRAHCSLWDKTADRLESTVDASQLVHTAQTLHYSVEQQLLFTADPEDEDLKPLPNEPPVVDGPTARLRAKSISGESSRALQP